MIYCVEDDLSIRELVVYTLQHTGFSAKGFESGAQLHEALRSDGLPELILLDIMLPDEDGISILRKLKTQPAYKDIPVIMVTAKSMEYDKIIGLDEGADDYITKPFGIMELIARMKAVLRRTGPKEEGFDDTVGPVAIDTKRHSVTVEGEAVALTLKEFELLRILMENRGIVLSRDVLLEKIWGYDFDGETRTVDVHIRTLRQKLGKGAEIIETVRGIGYRIDGTAGNRRTE